MAYEIGATYGGMTALSTLTEPVPDPKSNFIPYSRYVQLGNGEVRGLGWAEAVWRWSVMPTRAQRDQLKTFVSGASAEVYIKTRKNESEDSYQVYTAVMIWPQEEEKQYSTRRNFEIRFVNCQEYTP